MISMQMIKQWKPASPWRSMTWPLHYQNWDCWKGKSMINSVSSLWTPKPVILSQIFMKATMNSGTADIRWYLDYSKIVLPHGHHDKLWTLAHRYKLVGHPDFTRMYGTLTADLLLFADGRRCQLCCPWWRALSWKLGLFAQASSSPKVIPRIATAGIHIHRLYKDTIESPAWFLVEYCDCGLGHYVCKVGAIEEHSLVGCRSCSFERRGLQVRTAKETTLRQWKTILI